MSHRGFCASHLRHPQHLKEQLITSPKHRSLWSDHFLCTEYFTELPAYMASMSCEIIFIRLEMRNWGWDAHLPCCQLSILPSPFLLSYEVKDPSLQVKVWWHLLLFHCALRSPDSDPEACPASRRNITQITLQDSSLLASRSPKRNRRLQPSVGISGNYMLELLTKAVHMLQGNLSFHLSLLRPTLAYLSISNHVLQQCL